jgi:hypothetical protein
MKISKQADHFNILVSRQELAALNNCLNETLQCVDEDEFHTRVGVPSTKARDMLKQISSAYDEA